MSRLEARVIDLARQGLPPREISASLKRPINTVYHYLSKARRDGVLKVYFANGPVPKHHAPLQLSEETVRYFEAAATARSVNSGELIERTLQMVASDDILDAVLDDGEADHD